MRNGSSKLPTVIPNPRTRGLVLAVGSAVFSSLSISGCFLWTSASKGDELQQRADAMEGRLQTLETGLGEELRAEMELAKAKVAELETVLERATQVVTRASADTGAQVETLQAQIAQQEGTIDELRHEFERLQEEFREQQTNYESRMKQLARRAGVDMPLEESEIPEGIEPHWQAVLQAYEGRRFSEARALLRAFIQRYRADSRADDAQMMIGRSYLLEDRPATALGELRHVIADFAEGDAVAEALLSMGDAFYRLHSCASAETAYNTLIRSHARTSAATEARTRLRDVRRAPREYCTQ